MHVVYSRRARREITRIVDVIMADNVRAAERFAADLEYRCSLLARTPEMGPARPNIGKAVRSLVHGNYTVFYRLNLDVDQAIILSVWHSRRRPPRL
jgi:plasmid stabilization system protein ParE